jgi:hypothetical protein
VHGALIGLQPAILYVYADHLIHSYEKMCNSIHPDCIVTKFCNWSNRHWHDNNKGKGCDSEVKCMCMGLLCSVDLAACSKVFGCIMINSCCVNSWHWCVSDLHVTGHSCLGGSSITRLHELLGGSPSSSDPFVCEAGMH